MTRSSLFPKPRTHIRYISFFSKNTFKCHLQVQANSCEWFAMKHRIHKVTKNITWSLSIDLACVEMFRVFPTYGGNTMIIHSAHLGCSSILLNSLGTYQFHPYAFALRLCINNILFYSNILSNVRYDLR